MAKRTHRGNEYGSGAEWCSLDWLKENDLELFGYLKSDDESSQKISNNISDKIIL